MSFRSWLKHAFAIPTAADVPPPTPEEVSLLERVSVEVARRGMVTPALILLESSRPLTGVTAQFLVFVEPALTFVLTRAQVTQFVRFLERPDAIDRLCGALEAADARRVTGVPLAEAEAGRQDGGSSAETDRRAP